MNKEKPIRVALYVRVSTDEQVREGYGIEMQLDALRETIEYKQKHTNWIHKPQWVYVDEGCSGGDLNRPQLIRMLEAVKNRELDLIAVYKIDRLSRNLSHLLNVFEMLKENEANFFSLRENIDFSGAIGRLTFQIFGSLAEFERETIKVRTTEGKIASARMGNYIGNGIPYGYKKVKNIKNSKGSTLEIVPNEAKWVKRIFNLFVYEQKTYEHIAREFNEFKVSKGIGSRKKDKLTKWSDNSIRRMLMNSTYAGVRIEHINTEQGEIEIQVNVPPIVSEIVFRQAQTLMERISTERLNRGGGKNIYLLSRKIIDKETGRYFVGVVRTKGGFSYRRQSFTDQQTQTRYCNLEISADALENYVWEIVKLAINKPEEFYKIYQRETQSGVELERNEELLRQLEYQIKEEEKKLTALYDEYLSGNMSEKQKNILEIKYEQTIKALSKRCMECEENIKRLTKVQVSVEAMDRFSKEFKESLENKTREGKQVIIDLLVDRIEIINSENKIEANIYFRFAQPKQNDGDPGFEPANADSMPETTSNTNTPDTNGRGGWIGYFYICVRARMVKVTANGRWKRKFVTFIPEGE